MKNSLSQVLSEFNNHLSGMHSPGTCKCYVNNYVKPAVEQILKPYFEKSIGCNPFDSFNQSNSKSVQRSLIIAISESLLEKEIHSLTLGKTEKTIKNRRSGLRAFFAFLENEGYYFDCIISNSTLTAELKSLNGSVTYSEEDMLDIFLSRLITQDRAYSNMIYPARVMNQIFNNSAKQKDYKDILNDTLRNTKFFIDDKGNYASLNKISKNKISKLYIDYSKRGAVSICVSGKQYDLYTENPTVSPSRYEKIFATDFGDLSLDHDIPLQNILDDPSAQKKYPVLYKLSCEYATFVNGSTLRSDFLKAKDIRNFKKYSPLFYSKHTACVVVDDLYNDFEELYKNISFTIMLKSYNSSKGKGK